MKNLFFCWKKSFCLLISFSFFFQVSISQLPGNNSGTTPTIKRTHGTLKKNETPALDETKAMAIEEARAWLQVLGYRVTVDGVRTLKSLRAVGGTIEIAKVLTTANMKHLRVLTNLETLELSHNGTDAWVAEAAGCTKLRSFQMGPATNLTNASTEVFSKWPELKILSINGSKITDAGFAKLTGLKNLENLGLQYVNITDASAPVLSNFTKLTYLNISFTKITQNGLASLYNLKNLKSLYMQGISVNADQLLKLKQQLPNCNIVR